ncbi:MAG: hypothetical protein R2867_03515 [Caldilineaceae bacterium]
MTSTTDLANRAYGALLGLAYGDAITPRSSSHLSISRQARDFLWNTNRDLAQQRVIRLTLPFTHRLDPATLETFPPMIRSMPFLPHRRFWLPMADPP